MAGLHRDKKQRFKRLGWLLEYFVLTSPVTIIFSVMSWASMLLIPVCWMRMVILPDTTLIVHVLTNMCEKSIYI